MRLQTSTSGPKRAASSTWTSLASSSRLCVGLIYSRPSSCTRAPRGLSWERTALWWTVAGWQASSAVASRAHAPADSSLTRSSSSSSRPRLVSPPGIRLLPCAQDDDDTHEFSKTLAFDYINQAEATFVEIEEALCVRCPDPLISARVMGVVLSAAN